MTHAPHFPAGMMHVQLSAAVLDDGRFFASASSAHSRIAAIVAGSSIATTVSLSPDTPCCSSAPSDALVETPFRIPSTDTLGFAAAALAASCLACYPVVDSVDELLDLDQGSWEGSLPDSSSLGEDGTPLRGAFIIDSASLTGFQELTAGKTLSILREWRILIAIDLRQPGPLWSAKLAQSYAAADRNWQNHSVYLPEIRLMISRHCLMRHLMIFIRTMSCCRKNVKISILILFWGLRLTVAAQGNDTRLWLSDQTVLRRSNTYGAVGSGAEYATVLL